MDIGLLSKMVKELILKHDQVGLPGMGTFVAEMIPASFTDRGYTINPPYRRLSFFPAKLEEDLLSDFYAKVNNIDPKAAKTFITRYLQDLKAVLLDRKTIVMPGLGRLRATKDNNLFFVPAEDLDIFPEGFTLQPISLKNHVETEEEISDSVRELASIMESTKNKAIESHIEEPSIISPEEAAIAETPETIPQSEEAIIVEPAEIDLQVEPVLEAEPELVIAETEAEQESEIVEPISEPEFIESETNTEPSTEGKASQMVLNPETLCYEEEENNEKSRSLSTLWIVLISIVLLAFLLVVAFLVAASVAPDFVDSILYTPEELSIINY